MAKTRKTNPKTTTTPERFQARLSCNHTIEVPAGQPEGAQVSCEKCPALKSGSAPVRRIKKLLAAVPAWASVPDMTKGGPHRPDTKTDDLVTELATSVAVVQAAKASDDREERLRLSKEEWAALKAWKAAGSKGDQPETPNLDAMNADHKAGKRTTTRKGKAEPRPQRPEGLHFFKAGKRMNPHNDKLADLCWQSTKGLGEAAGGRWTVAQFRAFLAEQNIASPDISEWSVTLPNGVEIAARIVSSD